MGINCEHVWQEISNYLEGEIDAPLRSQMDEHFSTCEKCKSVREGTRNVIALYGDERMLEVPAGFGLRLEKSLEKRLARDVRERDRRWSTWSTWLVPLAALALLTGGVRLATSLTWEPALKSEHAQPGREIPPEMVVVVSSEANVFHVAGCDFIHHKASVRTITAKQAMDEGYVPCLRCMRKYLEVASVRALELDDRDQDEEVRAAAH